MSKNALTRILLVVALMIGALLLAALVAGPQTLQFASGDMALQRLVLSAGVLLLVSGGFLAALRTKGWDVLRYAAVWLAVALLIALLYRMTH